MIAYDYEYNRAYMPSAPFVDVVISAPQNNNPPIKVSAQIDSGSDSTAIPVSILQEIEARYAHSQIMRDITGHTTEVNLHTVSITIARETIVVDVIGLKDTDTVIIGRDILNRFTITLDGLSLTTIIPVDD